MGSKGAQSSYNLFSPQCSIYHICKINLFGLQKYSLIKDLHIVIRLSIFNHMIVVFFLIHSLSHNMFNTTGLSQHAVYMVLCCHGPILDIALESVCLIFQVMTSIRLRKIHVVLMSLIHRSTV